MQNPFTEAPWIDGASPKSQERALWLAVIERAFIDMMEGIKKKHPSLDQYNSIIWLTKKNPDFMIVCDLAGVSPAAVYDQVNKVFCRGKR